MIYPTKKMITQVTFYLEQSFFPTNVTGICSFRTYEIFNNWFPFVEELQSNRMKNKKIRELKEIMLTNK